MDDLTLILLVAAAVVFALPLLMASPTTPTHGSTGAVYRLRPNNFVGDGLNDVTLGTGFSGGSSAYFEVEIDAEGTPDTFKWRKDGGGWTTGVSITGAAQTLSDGQTITFAATTGHTLADKWWIGNLKDEPTTESGDTAQITAAARRRLNPNTPPTFTDDGGANVLTVNYTEGKATFDANVGNVDVDGNNGYIPDGALEKVGYVFDWKFAADVAYDDITSMGDDWEDQVIGEAKFEGECGGCFIGKDSWFDAWEDVVDGSQIYFLLQLFNYDPDKDQTGDHFNCWVTLKGPSIDAPRKAVVKERVTFKGAGVPSFTANV